MTTSERIVDVLAALSRDEHVQCEAWVYLYAFHRRTRQLARNHAHDPAGARAEVEAARRNLLEWLLTLPVAEPPPVPPVRLFRDRVDPRLVEEYGELTRDTRQLAALHARTGDPVVRRELDKLERRVTEVCGQLGRQAYPPPEGGAR